jgi:hypothetical protein
MHYNSVGIGAYLVRLGQRTIQMKNGPIILTGTCLYTIMHQFVETQYCLCTGTNCLFAIVEGSSYIGIDTLDCIRLYTHTTNK